MFYKGYRMVEKGGNHHPDGKGRKMKINSLYPI